jgi:hypothetical protein
MTKLLNFAFFLLVPPLCCFGQTDFNQVRRITKSEFKRLKTESTRFIPTNLSANKVLVVKLTPELFEILQRKAKVKALFRNGYDTTFISSDVNFIKHSSSSPDSFDGTNKIIIQGVVNSLKKRGIKADTITIGHENEKSISEFRYLLKVDFISTMRDPVKAWFVKPTYYFIDRLDNKYFEIFLPTNYFIWDLVDIPNK